MAQLFINRKKELEFLDNAYLSEKPEFIIISGRRRIGKSELVLKFSKNKKSLYFLCSTEGDKENIKEFQKKLAKLLRDDSFVEIRFENWFSLFSSFVKHKEFLKITKKKLIFIFDEFPFLILANPAIPSIFQKIWEEILKKEKIILILTGSLISIMERKVLSYKSPLYGRRTGSFTLNSMDFVFLKNFLRGYGFKELLEVWFVVGGVPEYLLKFNSRLSFWENIKEKFLKKGSYLYEEAEILLKDEFREPRNYKLILKAISFGQQTTGKICNFTGLDKSMVSKYIDVLKEVKIIREFIPVKESRRFKGKLYEIVDPYFNFWFRFIYPNKIDIEAHQEKEVLRRVKGDFNDYSGKMFEYLIEELIRKRFLFKDMVLTKIGKEWGKIPNAPKDKNQYEIDICALNEKSKEILFIECKWQDNVNVGKILKGLVEKAGYVKWHNNNRKEVFAIFAKSFSQYPNEFDGKKVYCFDLNKLDHILNK
jgi:hypothetical protein